MITTEKKRNKTKETEIKMTQGDRRRGKRKYRVRYDRLVILVLVIVVLVVLITSCTSGCFGEKKPDKGGNKAAVTTTAADAEKPADNTGTTTAPVQGEEPGETATQPAANGGSLALASEEVHKGDLMLVNADYECKFLESTDKYVPVYEHRSDLYEAGDLVTKLDGTVIDQLNAMIEAYAAYMNISDTDIFVQDGFRTFEEQDDRHKSGRSMTFEAGHCDYHTGRTFDIYHYDSSSAYGFAPMTAEGDYTWFADNACKYGFIVRYPEGKQEQTGENPRGYTYRYVGVPHAVYMKENNLCLEEYISQVKSYTKDAPLEITTEGGSYGVYYVTAIEGSTSVDVPTDKAYTVSGDNCGGFVVTVTLS